MHTAIYEGATRKSRVIERQPAQRAAIRLVQKFINEIQSTTNLNIRHVILFGSYAKNEQHNDSDIDLAIIADEFVGLRILDNQLIMKLLIKSEYAVIETHTYNTIDFENRTNPFVEQEIKPKGIVIL